ncbi:hypothetical protein EJB05_35846, partial [Eragrostis curvula]
MLQSASPKWPLVLAPPATPYVSTTLRRLDYRVQLPRGSEGFPTEADQARQGDVDRQDDDLVRVLPDDALTNVLRRLTPLDLAVSRCVREAWCEIIDDRRLLLPHLLPHAVEGIFIKFNCLESWELLARPMAAPSISSRLDFLPDIKHTMDHCNGLLLMEDYVVNPATGRICLSSGKYEVIKPPIDISDSRGSGRCYLGRSEHGVYFALVINSSERSSGLWVWILKEFCGQMEWVLKHQTNLKHILARQNFVQKIDGPWIFQDINYFRNNNEDGDDEEEDVKFEWDYKNDDVFETEEVRVAEYDKYIGFLGFHPYKEVVFMSEEITRGLTYHLNSSKVQDLGNIIPINYFKQDRYHGFIRKSFVYTPCWIGEIPLSNFQYTHLED